MNGLIFILVILLSYYCVYKFYPQYIKEHYHYYLGGFVAVYMVILYLFSYENEFMYKVFKNIYDTSQKPLYSFNAHNSNAELYKSFNQNKNIKDVLAIQQNGRCEKCGNIIMKQDLGYYKLNYKIPLQYGGKNDINNLCLLCPYC